MADSRVEGVDNVRIKYEELCRDLNMDRETEDASWNTYSEVIQRFSLEGDPIHWLCCALYSACRISYTPTVGGQNAVVMGNCVSLNMLLRSCNMSISQFLTNIRKWHDMANLSSSFLSQIDRLERTFSITLNLFQRYNTIFEQIFLCPRNEKKKTKYRLAAKCSSSKLYDLCWCLYLCAKNENPSYAEEIIHSFHLLICCIDFIYLNVLAEKRVDLINPDFSGVPENWNKADFDINSLTSHCIIESLCQLTPAIPEDSKLMKQNLWKSIIKEFFHTKTIYGKENSFLGILSNENFERNLKSLNSAYEQYILSVGEFDERILLNNPNYRKSNSVDTSEGKLVQQEMKSLNPDTPYTRKHALPNKEIISEPVTNATDNVKELQKLAHITEPTEYIRQAGMNIVTKINEKLERMAEEFYTKHPNRLEAVSRFELAKSLYFYLLEKIIRVEKRTKPNIDLKVLFEQDTFNTALIACSVEIVLDAYNSQLKFPWILDCFSISAFHFYKIIEIVVGRHEKILTRALIKHLNSIEETCLDSLIWKKTSPLWEIYKVIPKPLKTWADVDVSNISKRHHPQLQSPMNSAYDTFGSTTVSDSARRDLFNTSRESTPMEKNADNSRKNDGNKRAGSLPIFLRKVYKLAWIRLKELCNLLDMGSESFLNIIWTLFEYSITQRTELMQDRHLDQILMCAIYIYIKVREIQGKTFTDIMKFYRKQPQANSSIYREVLIDVNEKDEPTYKDIIHFYNNIYIKKMSPYALNFSEKQKSQNELLLSPHPQEKQAYPRKLTNNHPLTVQHMEKNEVLHSPNQITYAIGKSPAKDLEVINQIVRLGKRNLPFDDIASVAEKRTKTIPYHLNVIHGIIKDRQE